MDPAICQDLKGPEAGKEVHIEDNVWIGPRAVILAGVRIGKGSTVGGNSVVTKVSRSFPPRRRDEADLCRTFHYFILSRAIRPLYFEKSYPWIQSRIKHIISQSNDKTLAFWESQSPVSFLHSCFSQR